jgi:hypothetical protein
MAKPSSRRTRVRQDPVLPVFQFGRTVNQLLPLSPAVQLQYTNRLPTSNIEHYFCSNREIADPVNSPTRKAKKESALP